MSTRLPRFAPPSRGSSRVEAAEAILARVSDGPRRAAGRGIVEGGCEQGARMTTPPRRDSPARSSSAGWPRPEPVTLFGGPGWSGAGPAAAGTGVLPLYVDDPGGESHRRRPGAGDR